MKEELLNLLRESDAEKEREFNRQNTIYQREYIDIITRFEEILKTIRYQEIQGQMLKKF